MYEDNIVGITSFIVDFIADGDMVYDIVENTKVEFIEKKLLITSLVENTRCYECQQVIINGFLDFVIEEIHIY